MHHGRQPAARRHKRRHVRRLVHLEQLQRQDTTPGTAAAADQCRCPPATGAAAAAVVACAAAAAGMPQQRRHPTTTVACRRRRRRRCCHRCRCRRRLAGCLNPGGPQRVRRPRLVRPRLPHQTGLARPRHDGHVRRPQPLLQERQHRQADAHVRVAKLGAAAGHVLAHKRHRQQAAGRRLARLRLLGRRRVAIAVVVVVVAIVVAPQGTKCGAHGPGTFARRRVCGARLWVRAHAQQAVVDAVHLADGVRQVHRHPLARQVQQLQRAGIRVVLVARHLVAKLVLLLLAAGCCSRRCRRCRCRRCLRRAFHLIRHTGTGGGGTSCSAASASSATLTLIILTVVRRCRRRGRAAGNNVASAAKVGLQCGHQSTPRRSCQYAAAARHRQVHCHRLARHRARVGAHKKRQCRFQCGACRRVGSDTQRVAPPQQTAVQRGLLQAPRHRQLRQRRGQRGGVVCRVQQHNGAALV